MRNILEKREIQNRGSFPTIWLPQPFEHLATIETDVRKKREAIRRKASMLMVQSELLMENEDRESAEANLKKVVEDLEPIFESLDGSASASCLCVAFSDKNLLQ